MYVPELMEEIRLILAPTARELGCRAPITDLFTKVDFTVGFFDDKIGLCVDVEAQRGECYATVFKPDGCGLPSSDTDDRGWIQSRYLEQALALAGVDAEMEWQHVVALEKSYTVRWGKSYIVNAEIAYYMQKTRLFGELARRYWPILKKNTERLFPPPHPLEQL